jgi:hypothetical protein
VFVKLCQAERVRGSMGLRLVGTPVLLQDSFPFVIAAANKEFELTAGKFVPRCNSTMMNVRLLIVLRIVTHVTHIETEYSETNLGVP